MSKLSQNHQSIMASAGLAANISSPPSVGFVVYGDDYCGFTSAARNLLANSNIPFTYNKFAGNRLARNTFATRFANGHSTIPMIFYNGIFIGGYEQLKKQLQK